MKKIIIVLSLFVALSTCLFALTSCGGGEHEHTWSHEYTVITEATCTENGVKAFKCIDCDEFDMDNSAVINAAHRWGTEFVVDTPATCTTEGSKSVKCTVCDAVNESTVTTIPTTAHVWAPGVSIIKPATCTEDGILSIKCTGCDEIKPDTSVAIPAGHSWDSSPSVIILPPTNLPLTVAFLPQAHTDLISIKLSAISTSLFEPSNNSVLKFVSKP